MRANMAQEYTGGAHDACYHRPHPARPIAACAYLALPMLLHAATVFLSAFLLFLVQPVLAKQILPWFGGAAIVWTTCMVFFQLVLLLGYGYAHWLTTRVGPRRQAWVHVLLLAASLAFLPIAPDP